MEKKPQTLKQKRSWLWEFSKKIVVTVTVMFAAVFLFSCIAVIFYPDSTAVQPLVDNISRVFIVTVVSYAVKAGFENVIKISKNRREDVYGLFSEQLGSSVDSGSDNSRAD